MGRLAQDHADREGLEQEAPEEQQAQYQGKRDDDDLDQTHC